jgi:hypothetical protein
VNCDSSKLQLKDVTTCKVERGILRRDLRKLEMFEMGEIMLTCTIFGHIWYTQKGLVIGNVFLVDGFIDE